MLDLCGERHAQCQTIIYGDFVELVTVTRNLIYTRRCNVLLGENKKGKAHVISWHRRPRPERERCGWECRPTRERERDASSVCGDQVELP